MDLYLCKSPRELSDEELRSAASRLQCAILALGKVKDEHRWDYYLQQKPEFRQEEFDFLRDKGLTLILSQPQSAELGKRFDLSNLPVFFYKTAEIPSIKHASNA